MESQKGMIIILDIILPIINLKTKDSEYHIFKPISSLGIFTSFKKLIYIHSKENSQCTAKFQKGNSKKQTISSPAKKPEKNWISTWTQKTEESMLIPQKN